MLGDESLQLGGLRLHGGVVDGQVLQCAEPGGQRHQLIVYIAALQHRAFGGVLLKLAVGGGVAPRFLGAAGVLVNAGCIKFFELHSVSSCGLQSPRQPYQIFQVPLFQREKLNLLAQSLAAVKIRAVQNGADVPQGKLQLPKQQNLLQTFQRCIVIQPVTALGAHGGQQTQLIIVLQRAYAYACQSAGFFYGHHDKTLVSFAVLLSYTLTLRQSQVFLEKKCN